MSLIFRIKVQFPIIHERPVGIFWWNCYRSAAIRRSKNNLIGGRNAGYYFGHHGKGWKFEEFRTSTKSERFIVFFSNIPIMLGKLNLGAIYFILELSILRIFSLTTNQQILSIQCFMHVSTHRYHLSKYFELPNYRNCFVSDRYCFISFK